MKFTLRYSFHAASDAELAKPSQYLACTSSEQMELAVLQQLCLSKPQYSAVGNI